MNTLTTQTIQLPAHLAGFQSAKLSDTIARNIVSAAPPFISIQGNKFTLFDAAGNDQPVGAYDPQIGIYLDCTIFEVAGNLTKVYYVDKFDPNAQTYSPPACFSDNGRGASKHASNPQNAPTFACGTCPHNEWGSATSAISGKGIKACHDQQKVAVLVPGFPTPFLLRIPRNSLKNFGAYGAQFKGQSFDLDMVVTRLSFEQQGVGTLLFNAVNLIDAGAVTLIQQIRQAQGADNLLGRNDVPREAGSLPPPVIPAAPSPLPASPVVPPPSALGQLRAFPPPLAPLPQLGISAAPVASGSTPASPSEAPQQRRRRGRPAAEPQAPAAPPQAPFPHPGAPTPAFQAQPAVPTPPAPQFGMATPAAPDPGVANMFQSIFGDQPK